MPNGGKMKKKTAIGIGIGLVTVIGVFSLIYFLMPGAVFKILRATSRGIAGLTERYMQIDDQRICYLEGGKGDTILLLHGYAADKDNWTRFARYLTPQYHIVIPDLAGFGESSRLPEASYDIKSQVERLNRFTEILKLERFHIAGNSMGGLIAGIYGAEYPQKVLSLALLAPGGLVSPEKSEMAKMLEKGINPLLVNSAGDYERMLNLVFVKPPSLPYPVKKELIVRAIRNRPFNEKILGDMIRKRFFLEPYLFKIQAPTLIIWGDRDNLLHVSGVPILEKGIKIHRTIIMRDCGHVPMLERPPETADHYLRFLQESAQKIK